MMSTRSSYLNLKNIICSCTTYVLWTLVIPLVIIGGMFPLALMPIQISRRENLFYFLSKTLGLFALKTSCVKFEASGAEKISDVGQAVFIMNHTSAFDIPVMEALVGERPHVWMSKASYRFIPFVGTIISRMHVFVERHTPTRAKAALIKTKTLMQQHSLSLFIFPEGTRHRDGNIHNFKAGYLVIAQELGLPIIPIVCSGLHKVFPKGSLLIDSSVNTVKLKIGDPIILDNTKTINEHNALVMDYYKRELVTTQSI